MKNFWKWFAGLSLGAGLTWGSCNVIQNLNINTSEGTSVIQSGVNK